MQTKCIIVFFTKKQKDISKYTTVELIYEVLLHIFFTFFSCFFLQGFWTFTEGVHTYFIEKIIVSNALTCSYLIVFGQGSTYIITTFSFTISRISWTYKKDIYLFFFQYFCIQPNIYIFLLFFYSSSVPQFWLLFIVFCAEDEFTFLFKPIS